MPPKARTKHKVASSLRIRVGPRIGPDIVHLKKKTLREHRLYLMKQVSRIADRKELLLGPVDDWPQGRMTLPIPLEAYERYDSEGEEDGGGGGDNGKDRDNNGNKVRKKVRRKPTPSRPGPRLLLRDTRGTRKLNKDGLLKNGNRYLFTIFRIPRGGTSYFVLVKDLMRAVLWDGDERSFLEKFKIQLCPLVCSPMVVQYLIEHNLLKKRRKKQKPVKKEKEQKQEKHPGEKNEKQNGLDREEYPNVYIVPVKAAFILFGAAIIACGKRVLDDFWEDLAKQEKLTPRHRVSKIPKDLLKAVKVLNPSLTKVIAEDTAATTTAPDTTTTKVVELDEPTEKTSSDSNDGSNVQQKELVTAKKPKQFYGIPPYTVLTEQPPAEVKQQYLKEFSHCEHITSLVPGQDIVGGMELTAQFRVPKYHSKNSFWQASQLKAMDVPIGQHELLMNGGAKLSTSTGNTSSSVSSGPTASFPDLAVGNVSNSGISSGTGNDFNGTSGIRPLQMHVQEGKPGQNLLYEELSLNINGWKFENLPNRAGNADHIHGQTLSSKYGPHYPCVTDHFSPSGLPVYDRGTLYTRVLKLSPNQIRALEFTHDSVLFNAGVQKIRKHRQQSWSRYWQYKAGLPIGIEEDQWPEFKEEYLTKMLEGTTVEEKYNERINKDEVHTTVKIPNGNFLGHANIMQGVPPFRPRRVTGGSDPFATTVHAAIRKASYNPKAKVFGNSAVVLKMIKVISARAKVSKLKATKATKSEVIKVTKPKVTKFTKSKVAKGIKSEISEVTKPKVVKITRSKVAKMTKSKTTKAVRPKSVKLIESKATKVINPKAIKVTNSEAVKLIRRKAKKVNKHKVSKATKSKTVKDTKHRADNVNTSKVTKVIKSGITRPKVVTTTGLGIPKPEVPKVAKLKVTSPRTTEVTMFEIAGATDPKITKVIKPEVTEVTNSRATGPRSAIYSATKTPKFNPTRFQPTEFKLDKTTKAKAARVKNPRARRTRFKPIATPSSLAARAAAKKRAALAAKK